MSGQAQLPLPATATGLIPVAAYVRMSTEHQQYSTENQLDRIKEYAARRGMEIVRVFADEGKSGLSVKGRESLRLMIGEVEAGKAAFKGILAYDVMIGKETPQNRRKLEAAFEAFSKNLDVSVEVIAGRADLVEELVCDAFAISTAISYWRQTKALTPDQMFRATVLCFLNLRTLSTIEQRVSSETETDPARRGTRRDGDWSDDSPLSRLYYGLCHMRVHHAKMCAIMWLAGSADAPCIFEEPHKMSYFSVCEKSCRIFQNGTDRCSVEKYDTTYWVSEKYAISWGSERLKEGHIWRNPRHFVGFDTRQPALTLPRDFVAEK